MALLKNALNRSRRRPTRTCRSIQIYIGNVKLRSDFVDNIAGPFFNPLGKPYILFLRQDRMEKLSSGRHGRIAMEDVIEGGPWLFQGQPIVLQAWEQGMSLRRQKHNQIPVWVRLKHLPMEYWTDEGLSTVASGIGTPLYSDGITKNCSRLDYARVCVMLDYNSDLPKHLVVISPVLRNGKEDPKRVDVEYEWLPQRCKNCCSLGHATATCPANMKTKVAPPITIFVKKQTPQPASQPEQCLRSLEDHRPSTSSGSSGSTKGKDVFLYNSYSVLDTDFTRDNDRIAEENNQSMGPNACSPTGGGS
ncbi:UNVERIFIED_CONTAM: hypothetical protein Sradi_7248400 [Sesamum radiatum]|uniref:DUF4283 domain-containing protein n=1 Tax=Sesamum radiatum TaxID=300843 RepID=A0AAW2IKQ0_SESRA